MNGMIIHHGAYMYSQTTGDREYYWYNLYYMYWTQNMWKVLFVTWINSKQLINTTTTNVTSHGFQEMEMRNVELERRMQNAEQTLASSLEDRDRTESEMQRVIDILDVKIFDLNDLRQSLVKLIDK